MRYTISSLFLSIYIIIIYMLLYASHTACDYCRLFHDYSPTIPRLPCDYSGHAQGAVREFAYSSGEGVPLVWVADLAAGTPGGRGRRWLGGQQAAPRTYERGREYGREISRWRGRCLYLRRNCPLNARLCFMGILIYPRYKRAVYARFRGYFAAVQKIAPKNAGALHRAGGREKPRQASSLSGRVFIWSFSPRQ